MSAEHSRASSLLSAVTGCAAMAGMAFHANPPPAPEATSHAYVVTVAAPDVTSSADLAETAAAEIIRVIGSPWRPALTITAAASPRDAASACGQATVCEVIKVEQQQPPQNAQHSVLTLVSETARGSRHSAVQWQSPCGIRANRQRVYSRCRTQLADEIAQVVRMHDHSEHVPPRRRR